MSHDPKNPASSDPGDGQPSSLKVWEVVERQTSPTERSSTPSGMPTSPPSERLPSEGSSTDSPSALSPRLQAEAVGAPSEQGPVSWPAAPLPERPVKEPLDDSPFARSPWSPPPKIADQTIRLDTRTRLQQLILLLLASLCAWWSLTPPLWVDKEAPPDAFSARRATPTILALSTAPRPMGSTAHTQQRQYLLDAMRSLQLEVEEQRLTTGSTRTSPNIADAKTTNRAVLGAVTNLLGTLPGKDRSCVVVLMSHYDSVHTGPGAGDAASGVAVVLETIRALKAGPVPACDVLALLTDGEEIDLLGARAFVQEYARMREIKAVLNFEARGVKGAAALFEILHAPLSLVQLYASASPRPVASSLIAALYKELPNDTDLSIFRPVGTPGFNMAFGQGLSSYHTLDDSPRTLELASVQHQGEHALALTRAVLETPNISAATEDATFFNLSPKFLVVYPTAWSPYLTVVATLLVLTSLWLARRRGFVRATRVLASSIRLILVGAILALVGSVLVPLLLKHTGEASMLYSQGDFWRSGSFLLVLLLLGLGTSWCLERLLAPRTRLLERLQGGLLLALLVLMALTVFLPAGSWILTWPVLVGGLFSLWGVLRTPLHPGEARQTEVDPLERPGADHCPPGRVWMLAMPGFVGSLTLLPTFLTLFYMTSLQLIPALAIVMGLWVGLSQPWLLALTSPRRWLPPLLLLMLGLGGLLHLLSTPAFARTQPQPVSLSYFADIGLNQAVWGSLSTETDDYTKEVLAQPLPEPLAWLPGPSSRIVRLASAPVIAGTEPRVERLDESPEYNLRRIRLRILPGEQVPALYVEVPYPIGLHKLAFMGGGLKRVISLRPDNQEPVWVEFWNPPLDGFEVEIECEPTQLVRMKVWQRFHGLPSDPLLKTPLLPAGTMHRPSRWNHLSLRGREFSF
ncbi:MAG: M28 family peptidase [Myxococcota bacterium]